MPQVRSMLPGIFMGKNLELAEGNKNNTILAYLALSAESFWLCTKQLQGTSSMENFNLSPGWVYSRIRSLLCELLRLSANQEISYIENVCFAEVIRSWVLALQPDMDGRAQHAMTTFPPGLGALQSTRKNCVFVLIYYIHDETKQKGENDEKQWRKKNRTGLVAFVGIPGNTGTVAGGLVSHLVSHLMCLGWACDDA